MPITKNDKTKAERRVWIVTHKRTFGFIGVFAEYRLTAKFQTPEYYIIDAPVIE